MEVIRQAHQIIAVKVRLLDPLHFALILEENLEFQPSVTLFQAILQMPLALPCAASISSSGPNLEGMAFLYKSLLCRIGSGLSLTSAFAKSAACWESAILTVQAKGSSSKVNLPNREAQNRCERHIKE